MRLQALSIGRASVSVALSALIAGTLAISSGPASAAPVSPAHSLSAVHVQDGAGVTQVQHRGRHWGGRGYRHRGWSGNRWGYRHRYGHRYGHRRYYGYGPAAGIAGLIIGGAIAASQSGYRDRWERCDDRYKSFRWSDGTFQPYGGGSRQLCPYLRRD
ncbi:MAG: BA14K family protein [Hyphomicrobiaceae bacterium]